MNRNFCAPIRFAVVVAAFGASAATALASITDVNGLRIQIRRFNDYPNSTLTVNPPPPGPSSTPQSYAVPSIPGTVSFSESPFGAGGFANQHVARLSSDHGATDRLMLNNEPFDVSFRVNLDVGSASPRKEAGFRLDSFIGGEGFFFVTSDGEVAAFGGPFPFFSFGHPYSPGTDATLRMIYRPNASPTPSTMEYIFNGTSSGQLAFGNTENGIINGTDFGLYDQNQPDDSNPNDFAIASFSNITIAVPEPSAIALLAFGALMVGRRHRG